MTYKKFEEIVKKRNIPQDVVLMSDSGWEGGPSNMDGLFYCEKENMLVFTQGDCCSCMNDYREPDWKLLWCKNPKENRNEVIECQNGIRLAPIRSTWIGFRNQFIEELRKNHEFEMYYGIEESEEMYSQIDLVRPLFYFITLNEERIGYIGLSQRKIICELEIYIFKDFRRNGYAKTALACLLTSLKRKELRFFNSKLFEMSIVEPKEIIAMVKKENMASRGLMESCGFREATYGANVQIDENGEMSDSFETVEYVIPIFNN